MTRRLFGTLCGLVFLVNFGRVAFPPLVETLQVQFGVGPATIGVVTSLVWLGTALPRIPVGYLLTRVPRDRVVLGAGTVLVVAAAFTASATSILTLQIGAFGLGLASGAYFVSAVPLVGELFPERVGRMVGIHGAASQVAAVVAAPIVVVILSSFSWRETFWALSVAAAVVTVLLYAVSRDGSTETGTGADRNFSAALGHWKLILTGILLIAPAGFIWQGLFNFLVSYMTQAKGLSPAAASTMLTIVFAAGVPAFSLSGRLADKFPHVPYILALLVAFTASLFTLTFVHGFLAVAVVVAVLGYVIHSLFPALDTFMLSSLPSEARGSSYAVFSGAALLLEANGSGAVGFLTEANVGFELVFRTLSVSLLVVVAVLAVLYAVGRLPGLSTGDEATV
ncbi:MULTISPECIES: MFS transporter [Haloferax]|uniref:MFS transporter n=1 Tax=Haloferax marinum TaxID=2666143 RepID=A0A6A8G5L6_9EURY|nr:MULTISPECIES: MFS transporter [Haloferax]KAB1196421.1 MFS transporter [Haloferax sp. CBA1150]MRW95416.1 MFS transporter [Haloferax marinum]